MTIHRFADYSGCVQKILYAAVSIVAQNNGLVRIRARFPLPNTPVVSKTNTEIFLNCESAGHAHVIEHDVTEWGPVLATFEQKRWFTPLADSLAADVLTSPTNVDTMGFVYELSD